MERVGLRFDFAYDLLHASRNAFVFTQLLVGVSSECERTIIGHTDLVAVCQSDAFVA